MRNYKLIIYNTFKRPCPSVGWLVGTSVRIAFLRLKWSEGKSEEEDGEDNNAKNENAIVVREVNEVVTGRDEVEN